MQENFHCFSLFVGVARFCFVAFSCVTVLVFHPLLLQLCCWLDNNSIFRWLLWDKSFSMGFFYKWRHEFLMKETGFFMIHLFHPIIFNPPFLSPKQWTKIFLCDVLFEQLQLNFRLSLPNFYKIQWVKLTKGWPCLFHNLPSKSPFRLQTIR